ncbi:hypothetical protein [Haloferax sp. ATB1]|nr:hypothetical protein [Haloferax sp. ATB1]
MSQQVLSTSLAIDDRFAIRCDASWLTDHHDVLRLVLDEIEDRLAALWSE